MICEPPAPNLPPPRPSLKSNLEACDNRRTVKTCAVFNCKILAPVSSTQSVFFMNKINTAGIYRPAFFFFFTTSLISLSSLQTVDQCAINRAEGGRAKEWGIIYAVIICTRLFLVRWLQAGRVEGDLGGDGAGGGWASSRGGDIGVEGANPGAPLMGCIAKCKVFILGTF